MRPQRVPALPLLGLVRVRVLVLVRVRVLVPVPVRRPVQVLVQVQVLARRSGRATQALLPTVSQTICFPHRRGHQSAPGSRRVTNGTSHSRSVLTHTRTTIVGTEAQSGACRSNRRIDSMSRRVASE